MNNPKINKIELRVRLEETDAIGVVWHGNFARYFDAGRIEWVRTFLGEETLRSPFKFMVKSLFIDYHLPAKLDDLLAVISEVKIANRLKFQFSQTIKNSDQILASCESTVVCIDQQGRIQSIPQELLNKIAK